MHNIVTGYAPSTLKFNFHSNKNRHSHKLIVPRPRLDLFKCSFDTTGIGKENRSSQCLSYKGGGGGGGGGREGESLSQAVGRDLVEFYGCIM